MINFYDFGGFVWGFQTANKQFNMMGLGMKGFYTTIDPGNKNTPHWRCAPYPTSHALSSTKIIWDRQTI